MKSAAPAATVTDVVSVIEFPPSYHPDAARAEVQALFFLAGWREHAAPEFAPCLVCIDAPPPSVRWLAEQTGARLVPGQPFTWEDGLIFNRARAWDAFPGEHDRRLVLDPEVLLIGSPVAGLETLPDGGLIAAAPAEKAQVPDAAWSAIYRAVNVPMPTERLQPLRTALGLPMAGKGEDMPPFYHPAALLTPHGSELGKLWAQHGARLAAAWPTLEGLSDEQRASPSTLERVALATAVQALRAKNGWAWAALPLAWDGRRVCLEAGLPLGEFAMLHIPGLFGELTDLAQIGMWLHAYAVRWREALLDAAQRHGTLSKKPRWWAGWQTRRMEAALRRLYTRHVRPALQMGGEIA